MTAGMWRQNFSFYQISTLLLIILAHYLRIHWRLPTVIKTSKNSVWSNVFSYIKVCKFWKFIQHTMHWNKTQMLKKFPSDDYKNKQEKCMKQCFFIYKIYKFWKFIQHTIHWDKTQMLKKLPSVKNKRYKKYYLFSFASSSSSQFHF